MSQSFHGAEKQAAKNGLDRDPGHGCYGHAEVVSKADLVP